MFIVKNLSYLDFGPISFKVAPGEILMITGRSGAGKSTLLRAIVDLDENHSPLDVELNGISCLSLPPNIWRKRVGYLPAISYWWHQTIGEHFVSPPEDMQALSLDEALLSSDIAHLSSGEKQRFALLRLLENKPQTLLLDEPTANLDVETTLKVEQFLLNYIQKNQIPCVWISHNHEQVRRVGNAELHLPQGHVKKIMNEVKNHAVDS